MPTTQTEQNSMDLLKSMLQGADTASQNMQQQVSFNLDTLLGDVQSQLQVGAEVRQDKRASARKQIMEATFDSARKNVEQTALDLHELIGNLDVFVKAFGIEITQLDKPNKGEQSMIELARQAIRNAEMAVATAGTKWFMKQRAIDKANAELNRAKAQLEATQKQIEKAIRDRLMNSSIEQTLSTFQLLTAKIIERLNGRIGEIQAQLTAVANQKRLSLQTKEGASKKFDEFRQQKEKLEAALAHEEDILSGIENGTAQYATQDQKVAELKSQLQTVEGNLNIVNALVQDTEIFCVRLAEHEKVQQKLLANHKTWLTLLQSQTKQRVSTWRSTLSMMKSASDQEIAKTLNDTGRQIDNQTDKIAAETLVAAERALVETAETYPKYLEDLVNIAGATAEISQEFRQRTETLYKKMADHYGIDMSQIARAGGLKNAA